MLFGEILWQYYKKKVGNVLRIQNSRVYSRIARFHKDNILSPKETGWRGVTQPVIAGP